jgi:hypothetical protein
MHQALKPGAYALFADTASELATLLVATGLVPGRQDAKESAKWQRERRLGMEVLHPDRLLETSMGRQTTRRGR